MNIVPDYYPTSTAGQWVSACAMLTGVLVIAFPVSVFSDLWSEELKEVKGLESLFEDESRSNEGSDDRKVNPEQEHWGTISQRDTQHFRNEYQKIYFEEELGFNSSTHVVMERKDMNEIVSSIRDIQEQQRHIQRILKKYFVIQDNQHLDK